MPSIGMQDLLIILALALLFFGGRKLPDLAKGLGEGLRSQSLDSDPPELPGLSEKLRQLGGPGDPDDLRFIQWVADLCHPNKMHRELASISLMDDGVQHGLPTGTLLREVRDADTLRAILASRNVGLDRAAWRWATSLKRGAAPHRAAAAYALAVAGFEPAIPALLDSLSDAPPEAYLAAVHALANLNAAPAAPVLAAFAVEPPRAAGPLSPDAPAGALYHRFPLKPLLRGYCYHYQQCDCSDPGALPRFFARDALWELGEAELLAAARDLSSGSSDRAVALKDGRLFEALAVALARSPRSAEARPAGLAAIRGLVALGDARSMGLLDWFSRPWRVLWVDNVIWDSARAADRHARGRRGSHVVPSAAPGGTGAEVTVIAAPPERRAP